LVKDRIRRRLILDGGAAPSWGNSPAVSRLPRRLVAAAAAAAAAARLPSRKVGRRHAPGPPTARRA